MQPKTYTISENFCDVNLVFLDILDEQNGLRFTKEKASEKSFLLSLSFEVARNNYPSYPHQNIQTP